MDGKNLANNNSTSNLGKSLYDEDIINQQKRLS